MPPATERALRGLLRRCVHCGFCNAACPTYRVTGDEQDGPRGRIWLLRSMLETGRPGPAAVAHLDRCLTCRACERACPSEVEYGRLVELARPWLPAAARPALSRALRAGLLAVVPYRRRVRALLMAGRAVWRLLPSRWRALIPPVPPPAGRWPAPRHARRYVLLEGCVQHPLAPQVEHAAARVADAAGVSLLRVPAAGCCGALALHLGRPDLARRAARRNLDAWAPALGDGALGVVATSSACALMLADYGRLLCDDPVYAGRAAAVSAAVTDVAAVLADAPEPPRLPPGVPQPVALHRPCTLDNGLQAGDRLESLLRRAGVALVEPAPGLGCCGAAGGYHLLEPALAAGLREAKRAALEAGGPALIATANIGCQHFLAAGAGTPVRHWLELLDPMAAAGGALRRP